MSKKVERTPEEKEQARKNSLANLRPFKKLDELTPEEREKQLAITEKGKLASANYNHKKASLNELAKALLNQTVTREQVQRILGDDQQLITDDEQLTVGQVLNVAMVQESIKGNVKAYEAIRDTAGYSPKSQITVDVDVTTDADRALMEKISKRLAAQ